MRGTITYIMVAPVLLSAKVFLEITYCSTPMVILGLFYIGVCSPVMLWVLLLMSIVCGWPHIGTSVCTPSDTFPPPLRLFYPKYVILLQLVLLGITTGLPRWDSHNPCSHVFGHNGEEQ